MGCTKKLHEFQVTESPPETFVVPFVLRAFVLRKVGYVLYRTRRLDAHKILQCPRQLTLGLKNLRLRFVTFAGGRLLRKPRLTLEN